MKKTKSIGIGIVLLAAGLCYASFWVTIVQDFRSLATATTAPPSPGGLPARLQLAMKIIGVDLSAPSEAHSVEIGPADPAELAMMISRRVYAHLGMGVLSAVLGLVLLIKGIATPEQRSQ